MNDIANVLTQYKPRFQALDAFVDDISDLRPGMPVKKKIGENEFILGEPALKVRIYDSQGIARFQLAESGASTTAEGAVIGGILGAAIGAAGETKEGGLGGLLLGLLIGGAAGKMLESPTRVLAMRFEPATHEWKLYNGELLRWAKQTLQPTG